MYLAQRLESGRYSIACSDYFLDGEGEFCTCYTMLILEQSHMLPNASKHQRKQCF